MKAFYEERGRKSLPRNYLWEAFVEAASNERIASEISENWLIVYPKIKGLCFNQSTDRFMSALGMEDRKKEVDKRLLENFKRHNAQARHFL